jgi:hypothetical protein
MSRHAGATGRLDVTAAVAERYHRMTGPLVRAGSAWPPRRSRPLLLVGGRALDLSDGQPGSRATASGRCSFRLRNFRQPIRFPSLGPG